MGQELAAFWYESADECPTGPRFSTGMAYVLVRIRGRVGHWSAPVDGTEAGSIRSNGPEVHWYAAVDGTGLGSVSGNGPVSDWYADLDGNQQRFGMEPRTDG